MDSENATKFKVGDDSKQVKESCGDNISSDHEESRSIDNSSVNSTISSSSSELTEDASSFTLSSSSSSSSSSDDVQNGPLFELSDLMIHLPLRRSGLSKYYEGKSQSFTSLASVESVDDLAKKMSPNYVMKKKMKTCKSYLNVQKSDITKKSQRGSTFLSNSFRISSRPKYSIPLHKINF